MLVYRIAACRYIDDLSGRGAALYGGRWNSKNTAVLYTSKSVSLAMLEVLANVTELPTMGYCLMTLDIPYDYVGGVLMQRLPADWNKHPPAAALRGVGDSLVATGSYLAIEVPSAIVPMEENVIINPNHKDIGQLRVMRKQEFQFDARLLPGVA